MSTIPNTAQAGLAGRLRLPRILVVLVLIVALAAAALTITIGLVASGGSGSAAPPRAVHPTPQRQYLGGHGDGTPDLRRPVRRESPSAPANDGSQHPGARP